MSLSPLVAKSAFHNQFVRCPLSAKSRHAEEHASICQSNIRNKKTRGIARNFYFGSGDGDLTGRSLIIAAQTSLESDWQCDSLGPA
jgi:hypothetical protein